MISILFCYIAIYLHVIPFTLYVKWKAKVWGKMFHKELVTFFSSVIWNLSKPVKMFKSLNQCFPTFFEPRHILEK